MQTLRKETIESFNKTKQWYNFYITFLSLDLPYQYGKDDTTSVLSSDIQIRYFNHDFKSILVPYNHSPGDGLAKHSEFLQTLVRPKSGVLLQRK